MITGVNNYDSLYFYKLRSLSNICKSSQIHHPSETRLKLKSDKNSFAHNIYIGLGILLVLFGM